jgi:signal transduction histidine kinase/ligand-binding sensor domain-containing protein/DNA-binding response OmpR family regulator
MKFRAYILVVVLCGITLKSTAQNVFRFEHIGSEQGLSQNTGSSILFDSKGFMWIGTMNGLNRYDGYEFKIFKGQSASSRNFTNNRVTRLWEDRKGFIWAETYDGYYHFFNPQTEIFSTIPDYGENAAKNFRINSFLQYDDETVILGSNSGIFILYFDAERSTYSGNHYPDKGNHPLSNNNVRFVHADKDKNVWIGTEKGVNMLSKGDILNRNATFQHLFVNASFTSICEDPHQIWFGTEEIGIIVFDRNTEKFTHLNRENQPSFISNHISILWYSSNGQHIAGFEGGCVLIGNAVNGKWSSVPFHGSKLNGIYEDRQGQLWLTAVEFGVTRVDPVTLQSRYYILTPAEMKHLTDLERPQFFEDRHNNLWIGLHGGGLALYNKTDDNFRFYRNDPGNPNSISSDIIHSIAEDNTGQMWLGTGQFLGGIEKVILENKAFKHFLPEGEFAEMLDNVVRAIMEDKYGRLWVATKGGRLYIYDSLLVKKHTIESLPGVGPESYRNNIYSMLHDEKGYIWIGSKGDGLSMTTKPVEENTSLSSIRYRRFKSIPSDTFSLGNNNIYSICQDQSGNIWIGTYGNGLSMITDPYNERISFTRVNQQNSNLSSNLVRNLLVDKKGNLWVATTLGLNFLEKAAIDSGNFTFTTFLKDPDKPNTISYNDIVQITEDSKGQIWLGTFGAGADMIKRNENGNFVFRHYSTENGLSSDIIFGILEDKSGAIWFSTENGLTRLDPESGSADIFNTYNGLYFSNFSENTCLRRKDQSLFFGGYRGVEVVNPEYLVPERLQPRMELTGFQLFNKDVPVNQPGSPLSRNISFTGNIILRYNQNSFSIAFSALDFIDPLKINYIYILENFEDEWNSTGSQYKATYTNLSPGRYIFRVKSLRGNEANGSEERVLNIRIRPPWWRTIPAYLLYIVVASVISISIYKTTTRLSRYRNELLVEKKVNELKLQFFTNISHEIRTPLTLIISPIEDILSAHGISPRNRTLMGIIHKNAKRMLHLTTQLLDFRKIQNNKMILKIAMIDLVAFAREIFESFIPLAQHKEIIYTFETTSESLQIYGDPAKLDTVIYNIISNAIKFTGQGKNVTVKLNDQPGSKFVDISVTDQGPGIPEKNLSDIFSRYTILSNQDFAGTGIGLSLAYELARLHKGEILISSVLDEGSTFTVRLPKEKPDYGENAIFPETENQSPLVFRHHYNETEETAGETLGVSPEQSKRHVLLIVEDNQEILSYISQALRSSYTCIGAKDGEEGLQIAKTMNPDIIITDIMMPGLDGMEMTRMLKEDFSTSHIPVVMLTSKTAMNDQIAGIETGAESYIVKPFQMDYLRAVTKNLLNQRAKVISSLLGKKHIGVAVKVASRDEEFLKKIVQFVEDNYENDFSIDQLAEFCCVGRTVLYNKIKGLTGLGPLEFVRKVKLTIASQLLEKGYNVSEAAYKTGFSDVKYFSRQYKALFGFSPSRKLKV